MTNQEFVPIDGSAPMTGPLTTPGVITRGHPWVDSSDFGTPTDRSTRAAAVQAAIDHAAMIGAAVVYVPASFLNYDASLVAFNPAVRMAREGQLADVLDVKAYGAAGDGVTDDTAAIQSAMNVIYALWQADGVWRCLWLGSGVYALASVSSEIPNGTSTARGYLLKWRPGVHLHGDGTGVLKIGDGVGNGSPSYWTILFMNDDEVGRIGDFRAYGVTFDWNADNNTNAQAHSDPANSALRGVTINPTAWQVDVHFENCIFLNPQGTTCLIAHNQTAAGGTLYSSFIRNATVTRCHVLDRNKNATQNIGEQFDTSDFVLTCDVGGRVEISHNLFTAMPTNGNAPNNPYEGHGASVEVFDNTIVGYFGSGILAGADAADTRALICRDNKFLEVGRGPMLWVRHWANYDGSYDTVVQAMIVEDNVIELRPERHALSYGWPDAGTGIPPSGGVETVVIDDGGEGYISPPDVSFSGGDGTGVAGNAVIQNGRVIGVEMTSQGSGYTSRPTVAFGSAPAGGRDASGIAYLTTDSGSASLIPTGIRIDPQTTNAGAAYYLRIHGNTIRYREWSPGVLAEHGTGDMNGISLDWDNSAADAGCLRLEITHNRIFSPLARGILVASPDVGPGQTLEHCTIRHNFIFQCGSGNVTNISGTAAAAIQVAATGCKSLDISHNECLDDRPVGTTRMTSGVLTNTGDALFEGRIWWNVIAWPNELSGMIPYGCSGNTDRIDIRARHDASNHDTNYTPCREGSSIEVVGGNGRWVRAVTRSGHSLGWAFYAGRATQVRTLAISEGAVNVDMSLGGVIHVRLTDDVTISNPTQPGEGQRLIIYLEQDDTGGRAVKFGPNYKFAGGAFVVSSAASAIDRIEFERRIDEPTSAHWHEITRSQNLS